MNTQAVTRNSLHRYVGFDLTIQRFNDFAIS
jgi:hypothetical protein